VLASTRPRKLRAVPARYAFRCAALIEQSIPKAPAASRYRPVGVGTPSRPDRRLIQRRLAIRPATPSSPQVCHRDARSRSFRLAGRRRVIRDRRRDVGQPANPATMSTTTRQRRQLPTCRSSLVAARSQRVFKPGDQEAAGTRRLGRRDGDVASSATAPRGASPRASRRSSRRTRLAEAACLAVPADRLTVTTWLPGI